MKCKQCNNVLEYLIDSNKIPRCKLCFADTFDSIDDDTPLNCSIETMEKYYNSEILYENGKEDKAIQLCSDAANAGNPYAILNLAYYYENGIMNTFSKEEAVIRAMKCYFEILAHEPSVLKYLKGKSFKYNVETCTIREEELTELINQSKKNLEVLFNKYDFEEGDFAIYKRDISRLLGFNINTQRKTDSDEGETYSVINEMIEKLFNNNEKLLTPLILASRENVINVRTLLEKIEDHQRHLFTYYQIYYMVQRENSRDRVKEEIKNTTKFNQILDELKDNDVMDLIIIRKDKFKFKYPRWEKVGNKAKIGKRNYVWRLENINWSAFDFANKKQIVMPIDKIIQADRRR